MHKPKPKNTNASRLDATLSNWQDLPIEKKPILLKTFSSGLNHQTHLISANDELTVLKLFSAPSSSAIAIQQFAADHQLAPNILYTNPEHDAALMEYINSDTLTKAINSQDLGLLGNTLKALHSLPTKLVSMQTGDFDLLEYYETYLAKIDANDLIIRSIHTELLPVIDFFLEDKTPRCVCHNDLVKENCFITETGAQFIDWEYTQINNPWFDLAIIIYSLALDQQQAASLIKAYNPNWLDSITTPIYFAAQCAMLWCDILWHLARGQNQDIPELQTKLADLKSFKNTFERII